MYQLKFGIILSVLLMLVSSTTIAQDKNILIWTDGKLTWDDYQGKSDANEVNTILSYMDFTYKIDMQGNGKVLDIEVNSVFDKLGSYVGDSIKSTELLQREQLHFDIIEKYARLFRKELDGQKWEHKTFHKDIERVYKQFSNNNKMEQKNCDRETKKGKNSDKVREWTIKIAKELKNLDKYKEPAFTVKLKM
ncbi:MAG: hypothetical protein HYU69_08780 [Bacteroidetes bacterium]|nr:hypothetical protein [Bacteroidota bacterium]